MYLEPTTYQSHYINGKQRKGINMSVFFCVSLWLKIRTPGTIWFGYYLLTHLVVVARPG